jgi:hypothetical protein
MNDPSSISTFRFAVHCVPFVLFSVSVAGCSTPPKHSFVPQVAFLNHGYAVLDQATADAIEGSEFLKEFADFSVRTVSAEGGDRWTGRYLRGQTTYLELFGPHDGGGDLGSTGIGLSPDREGGLATFSERLPVSGMSEFEYSQRFRQLESEQIPWFRLISPRAESDTLSIWGMEYLPGFMNDPRNEKRVSRGPDDVISRARYLGDGFQRHLLRDICALEIATTLHDAAIAKPLFLAAGFAVKESAGRLVARDATSSVVLVAVPKAEASLRRVEFCLNGTVRRHEERIGNSVLTVGPGRRAVWVIGPRH